MRQSKKKMHLEARGGGVARVASTQTGNTGFDFPRHMHPFIGAENSF